MPPALFTGAGHPVQLGAELGRGGEGAVYDVPSGGGLVAKLYHSDHVPDAQKQSKLRYMASVADSELLSYAAWPKATLHSARGGPVIGFLMDSIRGRHPVHMFYSPAQRRQEFPDLAWDFLLCAARNTAAAFAAIHKAGHVVGDINQGNVVIGRDGKVLLIDTDSFQVSAGGTVHVCTVGVSHFTPPELQGLPSFDRVLRTRNHDGFGLALLIFHLLFGGRHPYSGVPTRSDAGDALEKDIHAYRYAYASDCRNRGLGPPPRSIPIELVPSPIQALFVAAFTELGVSAQRPDANRWVDALDSLRRQLRRCSTTPAHIFPNHLPRCPWCLMEGQGIVYFVDVGGRPGEPSLSNFVLARAWAAIEAVAAPPSLSLPSPGGRSVKGTPPANGFEKSVAIVACRIFVALAVVGLCFVVPSGGLLLVVLLGLILFTAAGAIGGEDRRAERAKRRAAHQAARAQFDQLASRARSHASSSTFVAKKQQLAAMREDYQQLSGQEQAELSRLQTTAESRQRQQFLDRCYIESAVIPGVGPAKKAALRSFGIETAADVTWQRVIVVKGFGEVKTHAMLEWRVACEKRFVFNPRIAVTDADKRSVAAQFAARRRDLESELTRGAKDLQRIRQDVLAEAAALKPVLEEAAQRLAQAEADVNIV